MFTNKHVIVAMIVAPILALVSYFSVDKFVSETPHAAQEGASYVLAELPNCRYNSGICGMRNGDFFVKMRTETLNGSEVFLKLHSAHAIDGIAVALIASPEQDAASVAPEKMTADDAGLDWTLQLPKFDPEVSRLHVAISANGVLYYGDAQTKFATYETIFDADFRREHQE